MLACGKSARRVTFSAVTQQLAQRNTIYLFSFKN